MANINRDYLIVLDAKSSVISEADELKYYITDEHSQNLFVNLVVRDIERINKYVEVHDPEKYQLELHIVKPNNDIVRPHLQANLLSVPDAIYAFELPKETTDYIGTYKCELRVTYQESEEKTITTSNKFKYRVKRSIYNDLDSIQDAPQYPVVIQLFDKLSDINQYEEDRRANELARQLAEEQRQTKHNELVADMTDSIQAMDNKVVEVENRITTKEQAVDKLIVDTKKDIDDYKTTKDQEIDEYKTAKDTEINNAITNQDNKIDTAISEQNDRIAVVENNVVAQNDKLDTLETKATTHEARITAVEAKNTEQDGRLDVAENRLANIGNDITNTMQPIIDGHTSRLDAIETINVAQNTRLDAIEVKNQQQDDRLLDIEKVNKRQDMDLKCLFAESKNNMIDVTEEGNSIYLQNSTVGYTLIDEIQGNTMVNCNKEPDKEITLNGNINTSGYSNVTLTDGVDGGLVDVALEGNTLVNVSKTKDSTALPLDEELAYLYANTQYTLQFVSDKAISIDITLGGTQLLAQSIVAGLNRITITTPETLADNKLIIDGVGSNISEVVVTDTDRNFGYFEGMKSVGECEGNAIEILSHSKNYFSCSGYSVIGENSFYGTVTESNGVYHYIGNSEHIDGNYGIEFKNINLNKNTKYTFSYNMNAINNVGFEKGFIKVYINDKIIAKSMGSATFTTNNSSIVTILVYGTIGGSKSCEFEVSNLQIEKGDSITNYNTVRENTQQLTHEPLRAVGNVKDKYVQIDGKWYIERNCGIVSIDNTISNIEIFDMNSEHRQYYITNLIADGISNRDSVNCICDKYNTIALSDRYDYYGIWINGTNIAFVVDPTIYTSIDVFKEKYLSTPISIIYKKSSPTYEPIDYSPFTVYSDVTHISNNSTIPCNMTIKNTGYNCLLKPSTTYTVSSNLGLNTVTTPSVLTEDCLRFYDTDTSTVTKMKNVMVLEGDYTTGKPLPSHFSGIESAFEQEYDEEKSKYKVKIRVQNEDASKENNITFYINEPLRGIGDVKDKVYVKDDKVVVERKCGVRAYQDGDFGTYLTDKVNTVYPLAEPIYEEVEYNDTKLFIESFKNSTLFYNSNVPVTSKLYYSYSVPIVDTVAQTANVTDQQDSMIIDLATQVAVMEMMLM